MKYNFLRIADTRVCTIQIICRSWANTVIGAGSDINTLTGNCIRAAAWISNLIQTGYTAPDMSEAALFFTGRFCPTFFYERPDSLFHGLNFIDNWHDQLSQFWVLVQNPNWLVVSAQSKVFEQPWTLIPLQIQLFVQVSLTAGTTPIPIPPFRLRKPPLTSPSSPSFSLLTNKLICLFILNRLIGVI